MSILIDHEYIIGRKWNDEYVKVMKKNCEICNRPLYNYFAKINWPRELKKICYSGKYNMDLDFTNCISDDTLSLYSSMFMLCVPFSLRNVSA